MFATCYNWTNKIQTSLLALFCLLVLSGQIAASQHIHELGNSDISECFICGYGDQASVLKDVIQPFASWDNCEVPETFLSTATPIGLRYYPTRAPPKS